jgi:hypothetical protein
MSCKHPCIAVHCVRTRTQCTPFLVACRLTGRVQRALPSLTFQPLHHTVTALFFLNVDLRVLRRKSINIYVPYFSIEKKGSSHTVTAKM